MAGVAVVGQRLVHWRAGNTGKAEDRKERLRTSRVTPKIDRRRQSGLVLLGHAEQLAPGAPPAGGIRVNHITESAADARTSTAASAVKSALASGSFFSRTNWVLRPWYTLFSSSPLAA